MLEALKQKVFEANLELVHKDLVVYTWGNVSGIDPDSRLMVIKPSGVSYDKMNASQMVVMDMAGQVIEGTLKPSSDAATHLVLYQQYPELGGVVHTHSRYATAWAQANRPIPALGTTHADYFHGAIPCTRQLSTEEINGAYELETGRVIVETLNAQQIAASALPAILVGSHGPFAWGTSAIDAVHNAVVLEEVARMAWMTLLINPSIVAVGSDLMDKHYYRKHGSNAYYGQSSNV